MKFTWTKNSSTIFSHLQAPKVHTSKCPYRILVLYGSAKETTDEGGPGREDIKGYQEGKTILSKNLVHWEWSHPYTHCV